MIRLFVFYFSLSLLTVAPLGTVAPAQETPAPGSSDGDLITPDQEGTLEGDDLEQLEKREAQSLDTLFADLKRQSNPAAAKRISRLIWQEWTDSGSDTINLLMSRVNKVAKEKKNSVALDLLDHIIVLAPKYAEGWNRRATLHFVMKEYGRSLSDIEQVLRLEPRHYGALSGLANILQILDREREALETWHRVLELYPANVQAQSAVIKLEEKLSGSRA